MTLVYYRCIHCGQRARDSQKDVTITLARHGGMECSNCHAWLGDRKDYIRTKE